MPIRDSIATPTVHSAVPMIGYRRYRPVTLIRRPVMIEARVSPPIIGTTSSPESVADAPVTVWRNSGRNEVAPNIRAPRRKLIRKHTVAIRLRNSRSGRIGSSTLRSWAMNATVRTTDPAASPRITPEPHAYSAPPHTATNIADDTAATIKAAPR